MAEFFSYETQTRLIETLERSSHVTLQNALMRLPDREVALALARVDSNTMDEVLGAVARSKAERVRAEIEIANNRHVADQHRNAAMRHMIAALSGERPRDLKRSYFRPSRRPPTRPPR